MTNACIAKFLMHPLEDEKTKICVECSDHNGMAVPKIRTKFYCKTCESQTGFSPGLWFDILNTTRILQVTFKLDDSLK